MKKIEMISRVYKVLRALESMPADAEIITVNISESSKADYIQTFKCIEQIADAFGTSTERRVDYGTQESVIALEGGMEIVEVSRLEGEP